MLIRKAGNSQKYLFFIFLLSLLFGCNSKKHLNKTQLREKPLNIEKSLYPINFNPVIIDGSYRFAYIRSYSLQNQITEKNHIVESVIWEFKNSGSQVYLNNTEYKVRISNDSLYFDNEEKVRYKIYFTDYDTLMLLSRSMAVSAFDEQKEDSVLNKLVFVRNTKTKINFNDEFDSMLSGSWLLKNQSDVNASGYQIILPNDTLSFFNNHLAEYATSEFVLTCRYSVNPKSHTLTMHLSDSLLSINNTQLFDSDLTYFIYSIDSKHMHLEPLYKNCNYPAIFLDKLEKARL